MNRICVFLGSSPGRLPDFSEAAVRLGTELARRQIGLVYGGASVGLMGLLARTVMDAGGHVTGVIPEVLQAREQANHQLSELHIVQTMHQRKALMAELADGFIAMPGGYGTLEEFVEVLTWAQLNMHAKPCALLNTCGIFDGLLTFFDHITDQGFVARPHRDMVVVHDDPVRLIDLMTAYTPPTVDKRSLALSMSQS